MDPARRKTLGRTRLNFRSTVNAGQRSTSVNGQHRLGSLGSVRIGSARVGSVRLDSVQLGSAWFSSAQLGSTRGIPLELGSLTELPYLDLSASILRRT
ncbi:hypothetical protein WN943_009547 [Citrus x changshan-huyou]